MKTHRYLLFMLISIPQTTLPLFQYPESDPKALSGGIFEAVKKNDLERCRELLIEADSTNLTKDGNSLLHIACREGHESVCRLLLCMNANLEARDNEGRTPFYTASSEGHDLVCRLLLANGASIESQDRGGRRPLHTLCDNGRRAVCRLLLTKGAEIEAQDNEGCTPLHRSCINDKKWLCQLLLDKGADPNAQNNDRMTPLHEACLREYDSVCSLLLRRGANVEALDNKGRTPLHLVCENGYESLCSLLLENRADINAQDRSGITPLMICCERERSAILSSLLKQKKLCTVLKDDTFEGTALHWACKYKNGDFCKLLLERGFGPDDTADTKSLLHIACSSNSLELVDLFLDKQNNPNVQDKDGNTPLLLVCSFGQYAIARKLIHSKIAKKINLDLCNKSGKTPLHYAVENGHNQIVKELLKYGAKANEKDKFGKVPLIYATEHKNLEMCRLIKKKVSAVEFNGMKGFLSSLVKGNKEFEELFGLNYEQIPLLYEGLQEISNKEAEMEETSVNPSDELITEHLTVKSANTQQEYDQETDNSGDQSTFGFLDQISEASFSGSEGASNLIGE